jgi:sialidase-1
MGGDSGDIDIVLKKSVDNGRSWGPLQVIVRTGPDTDGNPAPVLDRETGTVWLLFCRNRADGPEDEIIEGRAPRTVWITSSEDEGETWAQPREITDQVKDPSWTWYATGPCHGVQLRSGRLVVPCDHVQGTAAGYHDVASSVAVLAATGHAHLIYSDDHGESWHIGGVAQVGTNESVVVQTADGSLYLNSRNYVGGRRRAYAWSYDDGRSFREAGHDEALPEPICQASLIRFTEAGTHDRNRILFSNPASSTRRERMTVRISYDECRTWSAGKVLHEDHAAYSDLCVADDLSIGCLFGRGGGTGYEGLAFARFDLAWLSDGADRVATS